jgi:hypothetical protein
MQKSTPQFADNHAKQAHDERRSNSEVIGLGVANEMPVFGCETVEACQTQAAAYDCKTKPQRSSPFVIL